ncbi:hypothetical protein [Chitinolyticbacter albus]|uniref:hypothetical protein n=1 Tax=Chitinolyticbacter albus TaxID=2961951 RepID=UPI00210D8F81|nr:hypothetical protein [Chitinolyticbacter albus]
MHPLRRRTLTGTVAAWRDPAPALLPLPHPSQRNLAGFQRNAWFASDVLAQLRRRLDELGLFQRR